VIIKLTMHINGKPKLVKKKAEEWMQAMGSLIKPNTKPEPNEVEILSIEREDLFMDRDYYVAQLNGNLIKSLTIK